MKLEDLINYISLQKEVVYKVLPYIEKYTEEYQKYIPNLINHKTAEDTFVEISKIYNDEENLHFLAIYLLACLKTYEEYSKKNISKYIFIDTMKCFTRFINEAKEKTGKYYFDRAWWTHRQVSMKLFRCGELEYEIDYEEKVISIHIPSDAKLTYDNIIYSIGMCEDIITLYFNECKDYEYVCSSWLLSHRLKPYLNKDSNILKFQSFFNILGHNPHDKSFLEWLYKTTDNNMDYAVLPENTSLQRNVKKALLEGNGIGSSFGKLKKDYILIGG